MLNDLENGTTIIIDRYIYSGCVYTAAKQKPNLSLEWCREPEVGLPLPDLTLFLDISDEVTAKRGGYGTEKYETKEMQSRVKGLFEQMMQRSKGEDFARIDGGRGIGEVQQSIRQQVDRCMKEVDAKKLSLRTVEKW